MRKQHILYILVFGLIILPVISPSYVFAGDEGEPTLREEKTKNGFLINLKDLIKSSKNKIKKVDKKIEDQEKERRNQQREEKAREYFEKAQRLFEEGKQS